MSFLSRQEAAVRSVLATIFVASDDDQSSAAVAARANALDPSSVPGPDDEVDIQFVNAVTGVVLCSIRRTLPHVVNVAEIRREAGVDLIAYTTCARTPLPRGGRRIWPSVAERQELRSRLLLADGHGESLGRLAVLPAWARHGVVRVPLLRRPTVQCTRCGRSDRPAWPLLFQGGHPEGVTCLHCYSTAGLGASDIGECELCEDRCVMWPLLRADRQCAGCARRPQPFRYNARRRIVRRQADRCHVCNVAGTFVPWHLILEVCGDCFVHNAHVLP